MPSAILRRPIRPELRRKARRPQLEHRTPLVAIAAAWQVIEETSLWLGAPLPTRYAHGLAHRACRVFAHSASFREKLCRPGNAGRDLLYVFMRHWLAARLQAERPHLFGRLPSEFRVGAPLPVVGRPTPAR